MHALQLWKNRVGFYFNFLVNSEFQSMLHLSHMLHFEASSKSKCHRKFVKLNVILNAYILFIVEL